MGVTRFLLKPSKMDELEEAVRVMIENLEKQGDHRKRRRDG